VKPPIESIQYLVDVFIEGGYAENDEDCRHLDEIHGWLMWEKDTALGIDGFDLAGMALPKLEAPEGPKREIDMPGRQHLDGKVSE
jgi:hypothetical protein